MATIYSGRLNARSENTTPAQVMTAASAYFADRSKSIPERLLSDGVLTEDRFRMIRDVVATMVQAHDGDVARAVASVGGQQAVFASFGGSVVVDAKAPLDAYLRAVEATSEKDRTAHLAAHAAAVREHAVRFRAGRERAPVRIPATREGGGPSPDVLPAKTRGFPSFRP